MIFSVGISKTLEHTRDIPGIDHSFYGEHIHVVRPFRITATFTRLSFGQLTNPRCACSTPGESAQAEDFLAYSVEEVYDVCSEVQQKYRGLGTFDHKFVILCQGEWHNFPTIQDLFHNSRFTD